jgi:hypothetical protein
MINVLVMIGIAKTIHRESHIRLIVVNHIPN